MNLPDGVVPGEPVVVVDVEVEDARLKFVDWEAWNKGNGRV